MPTRGQSDLQPQIMSTATRAEDRVRPRVSWRTLVSGPADGALNMAVDEAILLALAEGMVAPTLRFYAWRPPCLSVGYAQKAAEIIDMQACHNMGYDVVRRPTGGRAVLHVRELAYSVALSQDDPHIAGGVASSYRRLSEGLVTGLRHLGLAVTRDRGRRPVPRSTRTAACFDFPGYSEITVGGRKLIGSAQVRRRGVVLQHGALPLEGTNADIVRVLRLPSGAHRSRLAARLTRTSTTLVEAVGRVVPIEEVIESLAAGFAEALDLELVEGELTPWEWQKACELRECKYATEEFTFQR
jgi:lipoate-protein ligase A